MVCTRKVCKNQDQIAYANDYNSRLIAEGSYAGQMPTPMPIYEAVQFSFKMDNILSYYAEKSPPNDLIVNLYGDGFVRMAWDPGLIAQLENKFSHC